MSYFKFWPRTILPINSKVSEAINNLNSNGVKIVVVIDNSNERFLGTISDGDIRRGLLKGVSLDSKLSEIIHRNALVVPPDLERNYIKNLMIANKIYQIPVVDGEHKVIGLHIWDEIIHPSFQENTIVVMAGGEGKRLENLTKNCPKPLLNIAGKPILEHIIDRAKMEGFTNFVFALHYLGNMISDYFGDGNKFGVNIQYLNESKPLGTAGAISLLDLKNNLPFLVLNGDVITDIQYADFLEFHSRHNAMATMAVRSYEWQHPFGVVNLNGIDIIGFEEKPISHTKINAGIYALNIQALDFLKVNEYCDMPMLFDRISHKNNRVIAYPMHEPWIDIGRPADYAIANKKNNMKED